MRLSSLRALMLVLAMVVQTVAGGYGVARAATGQLDASVSAHCAKQGGRDAAGDARRDGRHHMCESCLLCAGPPSVALDAVPLQPLAPLTFETARYIFATASGATPRVAHAHLARGPPAALLSA